MLAVSATRFFGSVQLFATSRNIGSANKMRFIIGPGWESLQRNDKVSLRLASLVSALGRFLGRQPQTAEQRVGAAERPHDHPNWRRRELQQRRRHVDPVDQRAIRMPNDIHDLDLVPTKEMFA